MIHLLLLNQLKKAAWVSLWRGTSKYGRTIRKSWTPKDQKRNYNNYYTYLTQNDFEFNNKFFLQLEGTAMKKGPSPAFVNIFMAEWYQSACSTSLARKALYDLQGFSEEVRKVRNLGVF